MTLYADQIETPCATFRPPDRPKWVAPRRRARLVVADDDADVRGGIANYFRRTGYEVIEAADGAELIRTVVGELLDPERNPRVDAVVTDLYMPHAGGLIALSALHDIDPQLPCIVISGMAERPMLDEARRLGAVACLEKPFGLEKLAALVEGLVAR